jgi:hypothetical protein
LDPGNLAAACFKSFLPALVSEIGLGSVAPRILRHETHGNRRGRAASGQGQDAKSEDHQKGFAHCLSPDCRPMAVSQTSVGGNMTGKFQLPKEMYPIETIVCVYGLKPMPHSRSNEWAGGGMA